jgi:hypothetical protein
MKIPPETPDFSFSFRLTPKRSLIAVLIATTMTFLTVRCGISQKDLLKFYNEIRKSIKFDLPDENHILNEIDRQLNDKINRNPELLEYKVKREVDDAILKYETEENKTKQINMKNRNILEEINKPKYDKLQKLIVQNAVYYEFEDGTMGIRGAWVAPDPREVDLEQ